MLRLAGSQQLRQQSTLVDTMLHFIAASIVVVLHGCRGYGVAMSVALLSCSYCGLLQATETIETALDLVVIQRANNYNQQATNPVARTCIHVNVHACMYIYT